MKLCQSLSYTSQTLHGIAMYAYTLGWFWGGLGIQSHGVYGLDRSGISNSSPPFLATARDSRRGSHRAAQREKLRLDPSRDRVLRKANELKC